MRIYVAGPMAKGNFSSNMRMAIDAARDLMAKGHHPFVPHLHWYIDLIHPKPPEEWLDLDKVWLLQCQGLLRLPGDSVGADIEVAWAKDHGLEIFNRLNDVPFIRLIDRGPWPKYERP